MAKLSAFAEVCL